MPGLPDSLLIGRFCWECCGSLSVSKVILGTLKCASADKFSSFDHFQL